MRSEKTLFSLGLAFALAVSVVGCGDWIDGKKKDEDVIELSNDKLKCMKDLPETLKAFVGGDAAETQLRQSFGCLRNGFTYFRQRTRGTYTDAYTADDLRLFFGKYFLKENNISPALAAELMKMKAAMVGGSDQHVTKTEIDRLIGVIKALEDSAVKLAPHMKILLAQEKGQVSEERLMEALREAQAAMNGVLSQIDLSRSDYTFEDTQRLLSGFARFIAGSQDIPLFQRIGDWLPVVESIKLVFFGERAVMDDARDWSDAIRTIVGIYEIALRYHYLLAENQMASPAELRDFIVFGDKALSILENSHQLRLTGRIPFSQINLLLDRVASKTEVKLPISVAAIKDLYPKLVIRALDPIRRGDGRAADSLERGHLLSLRREFNIYRVGQMFVDDVTQAGPVDTARLSRALVEFRAEDAINRLTSDTLERAGMTAAWRKYVAMMSKPRPMVLSDGLRVVIAPDPATVPMGWKGLTISNLVHSLVRGFMLGYGDHRDPARAGCTEEGLIDWYEDFTPAMTELRAFDPRSGNSGPRSHKEANFFSYSGNGDARADMDEMYEFLSFLVGAGLGNTQEVQRHMAVAGCELPERDVFGMPWLNEACFKREFRASFGKLFGNLTGLAADVRRMDDPQFEEFYQDLMKSSRVSDPRGGRVETGDLRTAFTIMHYAESLFVVHDRDRSGGLSLQEVYAAEPRFHAFLKTVAPIQNDTVVREAFLALVFNGQKPGAGSLTGFQGRRFLDWVGVWKMKEARRANVFKVFGVLKDDLAAKKK